MTKIYETQAWKGFGKQNYFWNEYWRDGDRIIKFKCHRFKFFDGDESNWEEEKNEESSWYIDDPSMPDWLKNYV